MTSSRLGQKVRIRGSAGGTAMSAKLVGGEGSLAGSGTERLLDSWWWGSQWINVDNEIVIPADFPEYTIFEVFAGAEFTTASDATEGIVRVEFQRDTNLTGAFGRTWCVTKGWQEINDTRQAVEDVYMGLAFHETMKEDYRVRFRLWNSLDIAINVVDAFLSIASVTPDPG